MPDLTRRIGELRAAHREQWFKTYKPFGWEVLDIRYGGLSARVDTTIKRLTDYLEGRIPTINELEEERLYFDGAREKPGAARVGIYGSYHRIATATNVF